MKEIFCIIHETINTQLLINIDIDHEEEVHKIHIKFWSDGFNGFVTVTPSWKFEHTKDYEQMFEKLQDIDYAIQFGNGVLAKLDLEPELFKP